MPPTAHVGVACVSQESMNTLRYAQRARHIQNNAVVNTDPHMAQVTALKAQVRSEGACGRGEGACGRGEWGVGSREWGVGWGAW
jgi:hypothetical protein